MRHVHEEMFTTPEEELFRLLHTPSAIRDWWGAARAIVIPRAGGVWVAAWGEDEDEPEYVTSARLSVFEPPKRLVFDQYLYAAKDNAEVDGDYVTELLVLPAEGGALLRVTQSGFSDSPEGRKFLEACERGWLDTFQGIRRYLNEQERRRG